MQPALNRPGDTESSALLGAARAAIRFDRRAVSLSGGLLAAIPVVALLGGGLAFGNKVGAVTMGAGAMLVGNAWRTAGGRPPLALMTTDAVVMGLSTFVGAATGSHHWIHLGLLGVWSLLSGLLIALGRRGGVLGTQAIIAVVVFGRFSEPVPQALGLAGYVLVGGLAQVAFLSVARWPSPLRYQRRLAARAYRRLAELARATADVSALPTAAALDDAQAALSSGALLADPALLTLRSVINEGYRVRVGLSAIHWLLSPDTAHAPEMSASDRHAAAALLTLTAVALEHAADTIEGVRDGSEALMHTVETVTAESRWLAGKSRGGAPAHLARRFAALAGQLRAIAPLAVSASQGGGLRSRRPQPRTDHPIQRLRADLEQLRANASLRSPAGRHAVRLAIVVPGAQLISRVLPLQRGYWMVVAAATVLRPEFGATFTRGTERAAGTAMGVALAGLIAAGLHPAGGVTVAIVALLAWVGFSVFPASFAVGFAFITALVVFLLNAVSPDTLATAGDRMLDTLVGGTLGLIVYAAWPTWSQVTARHSLAETVAAERDYIRTVLVAWAAGRRARDEEARQQARRARLTRTSAEATVAQSLADPASRRIDAGWSQGVLAAMRRLIQAAHVLRLEAQEERRREPLPGLVPLADDLGALLAIVQDRIENDSREADQTPRLPNLRSDYAEFERAYGDRREAAELLAQLDEIVDAANSLATLVGLDPVEGDPDVQLRAGV